MTKVKVTNLTRCSFVLQRFIVMQIFTFRYYSDFTLSPQNPSNVHRLVKVCMQGCSCTLSSPATRRQVTTFVFSSVSKIFHDLQES